MGHMLTGIRQENRWHGENCRNSMSYKGAGPEERDKSSGYVR